MTAFEAAIRAGCDGVELDVRALADDTLVLHHDQTVRVRGRRRSLQAATRGDLERWGGRAQRIEPLATALRWATRQPDAWMDVELKSPGHEARLLDALDAAGRRRRLVLTSFHPDVCAALRDRAAEVPVGLISLLKRADVVRTARRLDLQMVVLHETNATPRMLEWARDADLHVWTWGVRSARTARSLHAAGVRAFITDHPERVGPVRSAAKRFSGSLRRLLRRGRGGS